LPPPREGSLAELARGGMTSAGARGAAQRWPAARCASDAAEVLAAPPPP
jgi:hypothetical protein